MDKKVGRNDPCNCGSGKKFKNCCMKSSKTEGSTNLKKLKAKWLNAPPVGINLMETIYGNAVVAEKNTFVPLKPIAPVEAPSQKENI